GEQDDSEPAGAVEQRTRVIVSRRGTPGRAARPGQRARQRRPVATGRVRQRQHERARPRPDQQVIGASEPRPVAAPAGFRALRRETPPPRPATAPNPVAPPPSAPLPPAVPADPAPPLEPPFDSPPFLAPPPPFEPPSPDAGPEPPAVDPPFSCL